MDQKPKLTLCYLQEKQLNCKHKHRLKAKRWKIILQANGIHRKVGVAVIISGKVDFKKKKVKGEKNHFTMIKTIHQEDITHYNICTQPWSTKIQGGACRFATVST